VLTRPQVIVSQHLSYLRVRGMVASQRYQTWMIYSLPASLSPELESNLKCLQDCVQTEPVFRKDREQLQKLIGTKDVRELLEEGCCIQKPARKAGKTGSPRKPVPPKTTKLNS
jgi:ArsR family transcriptional regulator